MKDSRSEKTAQFDSLQISHLILVLTTVSALTATFFLAAADLAFQLKIALFISIVFFCLFISAFVYFRQKKQASKLKQVTNETVTDEAVFSSEIEEKLLALEEASRLFGSSLKPADMFRLISSRINEIIPFSSCALFLTTKDNTNLKIACAVGAIAPYLANFETNLGKGLAGKTFVSQKSQLDEKLLFDKSALPPKALKGLKSAVCIPLRRGAEVFGILELFGSEEKQFDETSIALLEAVTERATPLFLSSLAFEKSLSNALTDTLTNLPNERAFYLVLENQIAESQRYRDERPLTVLTVDIRNFTELNQKYGHATGDQILSFAGSLLRAQLRQMDFLARSKNDEFLIALPTASEETAQDIIGRLEKAFYQNQFKVSNQETITLILNFGTATFSRDCETAQKLLQSAQLQKQQGKSMPNNSVVAFPGEYAT